MLEDIAILSGAEVITEEMGLKLENTKISQLGKARRIVIDKDSTTIIDGAGDADGIKARIKQLKSRSRTPTRTSTAKSSRSGSRSWPAASLSSRSALPPRPR